MALLCKLFGHRPEFGYCGVEDAGYLKLILREIDGVRVQHADLESRCQRCGKPYRVGRTHLPTRAELEKSDPLGLRQ
jgi:hypothetical protein